MKSKTARSTMGIFVLVICGLAPARVAAQKWSAGTYGVAEYDTKKTANITGYVTKVDWVNPHAFVFIDSKDESGTVRNYQVEMGPPYALVRGGWKRDTLKVGDKVTVEGAALAKNGSDKAGSDQPTRMVLANGQKLVMR